VSGRRLIGVAELATEAVSQLIGNADDEGVTQRLLLLIGEGQQEGLIDRSSDP
jgi:hypothetical protein